MRRLFLRDCTPGDVIEDVYVITNKQLSATTTGKFFIKAFISDRSGQVTARMWNATRDLFNAIPESGFLRVRGRVENYQNNLQFIIEQIWPAKDGTFEAVDLMPHTTRDIDEMCQRLFAMCMGLRNKHLAALMQAYLDDEELMNNFCKAPAAMNFHHAFIGGLLEHTLNAMEVADAVCKFYPKLNRDLVVAGIFLHDIAKTWELCYDCAFGYTDGGQLVGHIVKSAIWVEQKAKKAEESLGEPIPQNLIDALQHIILSHHGEPEFGAARIPSTPEAIAVHVIENFDAKMMMALGLTRGEAMPGNEGNWTEYLKAFNGRLYRPDVARPSDEIAAEEAAKAAARQAEQHQANAPGENGLQISGPQGNAGQRNEPRSGAMVADNKPDGPRNAGPYPRMNRGPDGRGPDNRSPVPANASAPQNDAPVNNGPPLAPGKVAITNPLFENAPNRKK